jgi:hypothetical protein
MTEPIHQYRIDRVAALRAVTIATQQGDRPKTIRPISPLMRQATVVTVDATTPPSCTIQFDTVTPGPTHPGTRYPNNLKLVTGDLVYTVTLGNGDTWVLTRLASGLTAPVQADVFSGSFSTASTTYTDLATPSSSPGPAVTVLMAAGQTVKVTVSARSWVSAVGATWRGRCPEQRRGRRRTPTRPSRPTPSPVRCPSPGCIPPGWPARAPSRPSTR